MSGVRFLKTIKALFLSLLIASFAVLSCFPFYANAAGADGEESASRAPWSSVPSPILSREGKEDKVGSSSTSDFTVYLEKPVIESVTNEKKRRGRCLVSSGSKL